MSMIYDELRNAEQIKTNGSHIRAGVQIKGEISGNEDLLIDGRVDGPVTLAGATLAIGESGNVTGNIAAKSIIVLGGVTGNVDAQDVLKIAPTGSITGDMVTARISIEDGARCKGAIDVGRKSR